MTTIEMAAACREPLLEASMRGSRSEPSLFHAGALSVREERLDQRIRTLSLVILATAVVGLGAYWLQHILVRFVLALAVYYLLAPLIDILSCHGVAKCRLKLPRGLAIILALLIAAGVLGTIGLVVCRSISSFAGHSEQYRARVEQLAEEAYGLISRLGLEHVVPITNNSTEMKAALADLARHRISISELIMELLGKAAAVLENTVYVLLFLAFLLAGSKPREHHPSGTAAKAEEQIYVYIRGKVAVALLVALLDSALYWALGVSLWLVFGTLAFWLSFVPNVGMAISVLLPMPVVLLDPSFSAARAAAAFAGPLLVGMAAKDVVEPLLVGHSTSLSPVTVLLAVLVWGSIWGVTGMVLAVPLTAVARIYLTGIDHPVPRYFAAVLSGGGAAFIDAAGDDAEAAHAPEPAPPPPPVDSA